MRILFVNDDGYDAKGLHAVAKLFAKEHEIAVVAPDTQKSGYSHSVTLKPELLRYRKAEGYGYDVYAITGTPVDCVKLGLAYFFKNPDLVVSGINRGQNLGTDIMYSGTASAASDAASLGYMAVALSLHTDDPDDPDFLKCAKFFYDNFDKFTKLSLPRGTCININYPKCAAPHGVKITKMSIADTFKDVYDEADADAFTPKGHRDLTGIDPDTDEAWCRAGYITVTPLTTDRTDYGTLKKIKREKFVV